MNNYQEEVRRLLIAVNRIDRLYYMQAKKFGVKDNMLTLLYALGNGKKYSQKQVCEEWLIPRTTINTVVKEAKNNGFITLTTGPHLKEKYLVITEKGKLYEQEMLSYIYAAEENAAEKSIAAYGSNFINAMELFADSLQSSFLQTPKNNTNSNQTEEIF